MPLVALTRDVSPHINRCELTHLERLPIEVARAQKEHGHYESLLTELGCRVEKIPAAPELPDAVFVEDPAIVLPEIAILTRPGAASRRPETESVASALAPYRKLARIESPGTVDGGDVLVIGRSIYIGLTARSDDHAVGQIRSILAPFGYRVSSVIVSGCLHLKSAATSIGDGTILFNPDWIDPAQFPGVDLISIDPREPAAANALRIHNTVIVAEAHPGTADIIRSHGFEVRTVPYSELAKAEGALTCCSLIFEGGPEGRDPS